MGAGRDGVLLRPADAALCVAGVGGFAHQLAADRVLQAVVVQGVEHGSVTDDDAGAQPGDQVRGVGHGFLAGGNDEVGLPGADHPGGVDDGGEPGEAQLVDRDGRHVPADAGGEAGLAGRSLAGAGLDDLADDDGVDLFRGDAGALQRGADGVGAEFAGGEGRQAAAEAAERGAGAAEDDGDGGVLVHGKSFRRDNVGQAKAEVPVIPRPMMSACMVSVPS